MTSLLKPPRHVRERFTGKRIDSQKPSQVSGSGLISKSSEIEVPHTEAPKHQDSSQSSFVLHQQEFHKPYFDERPFDPIEVLFEDHMVSELRMYSQHLEAELENQQTVAAADLQSTRMQVTRLQSERDNLRKRVTAMEDFYKIEGTTFGDLEKMNDLKRELAGAQAANAEKETIIKQMEKENGLLQQQMSELELHVKKLEADSNELHAERSKMKARREADSLKIDALEKRVLERDNQHLETLGESEEALEAHSELLATLEVVMRASTDKLLQQGQRLGTRQALLQGKVTPGAASSQRH